MCSPFWHFLWSVDFLWICPIWTFFLLCIALVKPDRGFKLSGSLDALQEIPYSTITWIYIPNPISPSFSTHPSQHPHLGYIPCTNMFLDCPALCTINYSWSHSHLVKCFFNLVGIPSLMHNKIQVNCIKVLYYISI